ncbi:ABC transporter permease subunit [Paenibacillus alginolyticus]|uniref:ABC transporter permease subunit n=1 Tax=Paenibacillus alginolyticus TaxID=59839 RepID=A0ABT4GDS7_9BACL|nr:ABC transporter permease subunit [Paenibacillus alginolyticus]MCY9663831.1 ABC transporter permease subunit [Paenibacillus alginolyticus]MCY9694342.1 ABC transporter permease subunit [Paenibacillus alginolyticus]MEC0147511.1 ABC transporter permease subunit [Paenibacillus alginolyticus]
MEIITENRIVKKKNKSLATRLWKEKYLYLLLLPGLAYFIIYRYVPMLGNIIAFQDFSAFKGFLHSDWVGMKHFKKIFEDSEVIRVIWNTLYLSFLQIVFAFPFSILLSLMLNELRSEKLKRIIQSIIYLPHFLSWVVVVGIATVFLKSEGIANQLLSHVFGMQPIPFLQEPGWFMPLIVLEVIWKESGWGTIIFLAALSAVNPSLYEAAVVDGASRLRQIWHITLPAIRSTIVILLILRLGSVLDVGFEQIFLMINPFNREMGNVLDTFVYYKGIEQSDFSFATAVGLFKSFVGLILIVGANRLAKRFGEEGVF